MRGVQDLRDLQVRNNGLAEESFQADITLCHRGITLFFDARHILSGIDFDITKSSDASRILVWRYLVSIPSTALWSLDALAQGQNGIGGNLLRLLIEEVVGLLYYGEFPEKALRRIHEGGDRDPADIDIKLKEIGFDNPRGLSRLHGELSTYAAHANAPLPRWAGEVLEDGTLAAGNTPRLISEGFSETVEIINRLLFMGILKGLGAFPELTIGHDDWWVVFTEFTRQVEEGLPPDDTGSKDTPH